MEVDRQMFSTPEVSMEAKMIDYKDGDSWVPNDLPY